MIRCVMFKKYEGIEILTFLTWRNWKENLKKLKLKAKFEGLLHILFIGKSKPKMCFDSILMARGCWNLKRRILFLYEFLMRPEFVLYVKNGKNAYISL